MSDTPIADALKQIAALPPNELKVAVTADQDQRAASLDFSNGLGRHWTAGLHAEYGKAVADHHAKWAIAGIATKRW